MGFFRPPGATLIFAIAALASLCLRRFVVARFAAIVEVTLPHWLELGAISKGDYARHHRF
jgi:hypothetical protein